MPQKTCLLIVQCIFNLFLLVGGWLPVNTGAVSTVSYTDKSMDKAIDLHRQGHFDKAVIHFDEAVDLFAQQGDLSSQTDALLRRAQTHLALGKPEKAVEGLHIALTLLKPSNAVSARVSVLGLLGTAYMQTGRLDEAKRYLNASIKKGREIDDEGALVTSLNNLGNLLATEGKYREGLNSYLKSAKLAERAEIHNAAAKALANAARLGATHPLQQDPNALIGRASTHIKRVEDSHDKAFTLISIGQLYQRLHLSHSGVSGNIENAFDALNNALRIAETIRDRGMISYASASLGALYEDKARLDKALALTNRASFLAQEINRPGLLYRWQWQMGRILKKQGDIDGAIDAYKRAISTLRPIRHSLLKSYAVSGDSFQDSIGPVFYELADLLLKRHATRKDDDQDFQDLIEARQTIESFKAVELEDYFQDDCVAALQAKTKGIDRLAERTAALYPILLVDRMELVLSTPSGMKRASVDIGKDEITEVIEGLRDRLEKRTTRQYLSHARTLYDLLVRPIEQELSDQQIDTLVFIPDGLLRTIPVAALHDGKDFLIRRYAVATTPGLTLTDPRPIKRERTRVLLSGLSEPIHGFPPLPYVNEELQHVADIYQNRLLRDEEFIIDNVQSELARAPFSVVHIASHGRFERDASQSFLLAYDGKINMNTLERIIGLSRYRDAPVELLTLSACQTAAGDDRAALGLAGIAIKAGARSALASLWYINDRASSLLVSEFYRQIQDPNVSKSKALQQAQLMLLNDRRYRHPGYWAPFLLIGNWL